MASDWPRGCLQLYLGDGKGKTTAALGLLLRAVGAGLSVYLGQFLKARDCSEHAGLAKLGEQVKAERFGSGRWVKGQPGEEEFACAAKGLTAVREALLSRRYQVVILDEALDTIGFGLIPLADWLDLLRQRPEQVEVIMTGRAAPPELIALADLVTEMKAVKHYYQTGLKARTGIEK